MQVIQGHGSGVQCLALDDNEALAAAGAEDGSVRLFRLDGRGTALLHCLTLPSERGTLLGIPVKLTMLCKRRHTCLFRA